MTGLLERSTRASAWLLAGQWVARLLGLASMFVLARLLSPADFGLVAVATSYLGLVQGLSTFNSSRALIKLRDEDRALYDTAWTLSAARGLVLGGLIIASGPLTAAFLGDERLAPVIQVIGLLPFIGGLANPKFVVFEMQVDFSRVAMVEFVAKVASIACAIVAAVAMRSYWALVIGAVVAVAARSLLTYLVLPYLPRVSVIHSRRIFSFTAWISLANALNTISSTVDNLIIARLLGVADVGFYRITWQIAALPNDGLLAPLERVLFAGFTEISNDPQRLKARVLEVIGILASVALPFAVGLALTASEFVPLMLGEQWSACVPFLQLVLPFFAVSMVVTSANPAAMAVGATRQVFNMALTFGVLRLPIFVAGVMYFGLPGAMYALAAVSVLWWVCSYRLLNGAVAVEVGQLLNSVHRQVISALAMAGAVIGATVFLSSAEPWMLLCAKALIGAVAYTACHGILWWVEGRPAGIEARVVQVFRGRATPLANA